ncbi:HAD-IA family hydrolase [Peribacillus kribbensis]|uniref:HAD-IA family hydrolase n=1 Tax=Peribacillus kribbensis TaxID=356658 RepID=UPI0004245544|nr:HAD-IA family hydrolase [Peribacillus kribbensis]
MNILWDFDGTLFDTYPAYTKVMSQVLGSGAEEKEIYGHLKISLGHAIEHYQMSESQLKEVDRLNQLIDPKDMIPFEQAEEVLKFADKNVIMTHKHRAGVLAVLKHHGWEKYFADMVTIDDGFPRKPDSASYLYLHKKHHIDLAIGDRLLDILPAKELGIAGCLFQNQQEGADYYLNHYSEFFNVVYPGNSAR